MSRRAPLPIGRTGCLWPSATHEGLLSENKAVGFRATCGLGQILENCLIPAKTEVNVGMLKISQGGLRFPVSAPHVVFQEHHLLR